MNYATPESAANWAPIIPNVSDDVEPKLFEANDLLSAYRDQTTITVRNADNLSFKALGELTRLSDAQSLKHPGLLNRLDPEALANGGGLVAFASRANLITAVVHACQSEAQKATCLHVGGLVSDGSVPGIGVPLVAALFLGNGHRSGEEDDGEAEARILPNGHVNVGSSKTFMRLGFCGTEVFSHPVTTCNPQKTVSGSAEPDGAPLWYLRMAGKACEIADLARDALDAWSVTLGAIKES